MSYYMPTAQDFRLSRPWTSALIDDMDNGLLDAKQLFEMCMGTMSEADVKLMCQSNDIQPQGMQDEEDDIEDDATFEESGDGMTDAEADDDLLCDKG
jgi:hypothetical protein